jgi:predicted enzyme related to lactoylglutathione lyase
MEAVDVRGRFVWHQLLTRDIPGAKKFYSRLVGWKTQPWPLDPGYTVCHAGDVPTAGMMEMTPDIPAEVPSHWLQYIGTRDVDGTAEAAVRAGGSILKPPSDMKGAGRYAVLQDPQGALFAIIDPENARAEPSGIPPLATFSWHELATTDHEAAFAFYSELFGWEALVRMDMGPLGIYLIFGQDQVQKGGIYIKPPDSPGPAHWLPYAHVRDVDRAVPDAEAHGATVRQPPTDVPGGSRVAILSDPAGAAFAIHSIPAESMPAQSTASAAQAPAKPRSKSKTTAVKAKGRAKPKAKGKPKAKVKAKAKAKKKVPARANLRRRAKVSSRSKAKARTKTTRGRAPVRKKKGKSMRRKK